MQTRFGYLGHATLLSVLALGLCANCGDDSVTPVNADNDGGIKHEAGSDAPHDNGDDDAGSDASTDADADAETPSCDDSTMRAIPAGTFSRAGTQVTTAAFCLDRTEVTLADFRACVDADKCDPIPAEVDERCNVHFTGRDNHPVDCVTVKQATAFCASKGKRLPSIDELSWAGRGAVADAKYPWGTQDPTVGDNRLCWKPSSPDHTCEVGSFPNGASPQGVLDLAGNVWEWTSTEPEEGQNLVQGGAYFDEEPLLLFQADHSEPMTAAFPAPAYGFRCAK